MQLAGQIVQANLGAAHTAFDQGIGTVIFETLPAASFSPIANQLPPELQAIGDAAVDAINQGLEAGALVLASRAMTSASSILQGWQTRSAQIPEPSGS